MAKLGHAGFVPFGLTVIGLKSFKCVTMPFDEKRVTVIHKIRLWERRKTKKWVSL